MKYFVVFIILFAAIGCVTERPTTTNESALPGSQNLSDELASLDAASIEETDTGSYPFSIAELMEREFDGRDLRIEDTLATTDAYTRYRISYLSGDLRISGIMNKPHGDGPFPALILNHGYIDPAIYTNGRGLKREQDYLARRGYVVMHPDYRNHAFSDKDTRDRLAVRFSYIEDVINAVYAVKASELAYLDGERVGMLGHSMGGGITLGVITASPELVDAAVLFAPVTGDYRDSYERWLKNDDQNDAQTVAEVYGTPEQSPAFWDAIAPERYYDRVTVPVVIHHGTRDADVPLEWSQDTEEKLGDAGVDVSLQIYEGEPHEFAAAWLEVMERTAAFFDEKVK